MDSVAEDKKKKVEIIHEALNQFIEQRRNNHGERKRHDEEGDELLSQLLSKLDSLEKDATITTHLPPEASGEEENDCDKREVEVDRIVAELKGLRRQNKITHCLLLVAIGITTFWQLSEVSLLLSVKQKFSNPLKAFVDMIQGSLKGKDKKPADEAPMLPHIGYPELPHMKVPSLKLDTLED